MYNSTLSPIKFRFLYWNEDRSIAAAMGVGGRSASFCGLIRLKRQVRAAHGRVLRPKPTSKQINPTQASPFQVQ